jgi:hypothetical protein
MINKEVMANGHFGTCQKSGHWWPLKMASKEHLLEVPSLVFPVNFSLPSDVCFPIELGLPKLPVL